MPTTNLLVSVLILVFVIHIVLLWALFGQLVRRRSKSQDFLLHSRGNPDEMRDETRATMEIQREEMAKLDLRRKQMDARNLEQSKRMEELLSIQRQQLDVLNRMSERLGKAG